MDDNQPNFIADYDDLISLENKNKKKNNKNNYTDYDNQSEKSYEHSFIIRWIRKASLAVV